MKTLQTLLLGAVLLGVISCSSQTKVLNSYIGASKQQVIAKFGKPTEVTPDGNNGEILWYDHVSSIRGSTGSVFTTGSSQLQVTQGLAGNVYKDATAIYINAEGKVYHWSKSR